MLSGSREKTFAAHMMIQKNLSYVNRAEEFHKALIKHFFVIMVRYGILIMNVVINLMKENGEG